MTDKLKPCPFCGGEASVVNGYCSHWITCKTCFCGTDVFEELEEAINRWNTRKPMDSIVELLEKVKKYNEDSYEEWEGETVAQYYEIRANTYKHAIEIVKGVQNG
jgi:Lar family restriction alleviation protein